MPELPEVEVTRRSFASAIQGARVTGLRLGKPLRWPLGVDPETLLGSRVGSTQRRGKYLWLPLERGDAGPPQIALLPSGGGLGEAQPLGPTSAGGLLMHLGMSGSLAFLDTTPAPGAHDHFDLHTDHGLLRLTDPRRFGAVVWGAALDAEPVATLLGSLGLEPFDERFDGLHLHAALSGRRVSIKQALLAGDIVVGAGNIYACEALFMAGIDPRLPAGKLSRPRADKLAAAVRTVLAQALEAGGTTLRDFRDAHGVAGSFQMQAQIYGREGEACRRCGTAIRRIVQGARSTFFCPQCQKR